MEITSPISLFLYYVFCPLLDPLIISIFYFSSHQLITICHSSHTKPQAGRVPVGAAATQHNLNDLIVIHSIPLQQRNLGVPDRSQYDHILLS